MGKAVRQSHRRSATPRGKHISSQVAFEDILRREEREARREAALAEARREQERLERRIAREKVEPAIGATLGAGYTSKVTEPEPVVDLVDNEPEPMPILRLRFPDLPWEGD